ncbi:hypothetical protein R50073_23370 [Maricurvus nonylphenolicus]|uniref:hypothetical protein n=1 Tax=Maricurvus nonylphenolicus TaxID=1008307 RepID=UPI0036F1BF4E
MSTPAEFQDSKQLLSEDGFATGDVWYHGTSSGLVASIQLEGLKRSGDKAMKQAAKQTMATIGNNFTESFEPVFLTQSKELAYYWAQLAVRNRSVRFEAEEQPAILEVKLPEELKAGVRPDVGAAGLLMVKEGEAYMAYVAGLFENAGLTAPQIDLMKADRMEYLNKLGMAYYDKDIPTEYVSEVSA